MSRSQPQPDGSGPGPDPPGTRQGPATARPAPVQGGAAGAARRRLDTERLVGLLQDDSPVVLEGVRRELAARGRRARPHLLRAARAEAPRLRGRARQLLLDLERERAVRRLLRYASRREVDLETGLFLLDAVIDPGFDPRPHRRVLDGLADAVRVRLRRPGTDGLPRRRGDVLAEVLHGDLGYDGADEEYHHPAHVSLARTLERKCGMPLTLCAIYALVARRAGLEADLLPVPGHVLLAVREERGRTLIDAFGEGEPVDREHVLGYLAAHGLSFRSAWLRPAPAASMLLRHTRNLVQSLRAREHHADARSLVRVEQVLMRHPDVRTSQA